MSTSINELRREDLRKLVALAKDTATKLEETLDAFDKGEFTSATTGEPVSFEEGSFAWDFMGENAVAGYRILAYVGERVRRTLQPTWQGFEVGDDLLREDTYGPQPPVPRSERPEEDV
jgi:hypothetical protein